jgi:4-hydroxybenzoate polyprenyltransferase
MADRNPMTQVYQHEEDAKRGDRTFSLMMGIRGTFYFVGGIFTVATACFVAYFVNYFDLRYAMIFVLALLPVVLYFFYWFIQVYKDPTKADHSSTMRLNTVSATCLNAFFLYLFLDSTHVLQTF